MLIHFGEASSIFKQKCPKSSAGWQVCDTMQDISSHKINDATLCTPVSHKVMLRRFPTKINDGTGDEAMCKLYYINYTTTKIFLDDHKHQIKRK